MSIFWSENQIPSTGGSKGRHGGGHKDRERSAGASDKKKADRAKQDKIAKDRGQRDTSGKKGKPSGRKPKGRGSSLPGLGDW